MDDYTKVDISSWHRKSLYNFYKNYSDPFFNITANVDVSKFYRKSKESEISFFLGSLFYARLAADKTEGFKLRKIDENVVEFHTLHLGSTILYDDKSFGFCYFDGFTDLDAFQKHAKQRIAEFKKEKSLVPKIERINLIYFSIIPWVSFTSFKHARMDEADIGIPKIVIGKIFKQNASMLMPVSVEVNHSLVDGYHVGRFYQNLQNMLDKV